MIWDSTFFKLFLVLMSVTNASDAPKVFRQKGDYWDIVLSENKKSKKPLKVHVKNSEGSKKGIVLEAHGIYDTKFTTRAHRTIKPQPKVTTTNAPDAKAKTRPKKRVKKTKNIKNKVDDEAKATKRKAVSKAQEAEKAKQTKKKTHEQKRALKRAHKKLAKSKAALSSARKDLAKLRKTIKKCKKTMKNREEALKALRNAEKCLREAKMRLKGLRLDPKTKGRQQKKKNRKKAERAKRVHKRNKNIKAKADQMKSVATDLLAKPGEKNPTASFTDAEYAAKVFKPGQMLAKKMMVHAWKGYRKYAWGFDELCPVSKKGKATLAPSSMALTMIDALDTLHLMGMKREFNKAADFVLNKVSFDQNATVSMFETNIRVVGGLLGAYSLTKDKRFADKALNMGERFLVNFRHGTFPKNSVNLTKFSKFSKEKLRTNKPSAKTQSSANKDMRSLAQLGTLSLEFGYLSRISGDPIYRNRAVKIIEELEKMKSTIHGLLPNFIQVDKTVQPFETYSVGAEANSFYEYLLKYWLFTGKKDEMHRRMYLKAVKAIKANLIAEVDGKKFLIFKHQKEYILQLHHLACFAPGMLALGAVNENDQESLNLASELAETCYLMHKQQKHGIGSEAVSIPDLKPLREADFYSLRPEVVESIFIMWRITKDPKYRQWGFEIANAIEYMCKIKSGGYAGVEGVNMTPWRYRDSQESFFLAKTLKYLYLLFSSDDVLPLDKWVFNTEAHPFPIMDA